MAGDRYEEVQIVGDRELDSEWRDKSVIGKKHTNHFQEVLDTLTKF